MSEGEYLWKLEERAVNYREMRVAVETATRLLSQLDGFHKRGAVDRLGMRGLHYKVVDIRNKLVRHEALLQKDLAELAQYFHGQDGIYANGGAAQRLRQLRELKVRLDGARALATNPVPGIRSAS